MAEECGMKSISPLLVPCCHGFLCWLQFTLKIGQLELTDEGSAEDYDDKYWGISDLTDCRILETATK